MRGALFDLALPFHFASLYIHDRLFKFKPDAFSIAPAPTRAFWRHVLESKIEATIGKEGDMIGWEDDEETVGPVALAAKDSLLRAVPVIMPEESPSIGLYRFTLEHGDFGIHNTTVVVDSEGQPQVTPLFDWETGCIAPALLTDPLVAVSPIDLVVDDSGMPSTERIPEDCDEESLEEYNSWANHYIEVRTPYAKIASAYHAIHLGSLQSLTQYASCDSSWQASAALVVRFARLAGRRVRRVLRRTRCLGGGAPTRSRLLIIEIETWVNEQRTLLSERVKLHREDARDMRKNALKIKAQHTATLSFPNRPEVVQAFIAAKMTVPENLLEDLPGLDS